MHFWTIHSFANTVLTPLCLFYPSPRFCVFLPPSSCGRVSLWCTSCWAPWFSFVTSRFEKKYICTFQHIKFSILIWSPIFLELALQPNFCWHCIIAIFVFAVGPHHWNRRRTVYGEFGRRTSCRCGQFWPGERRSGRSCIFLQCYNEIFPSSLNVNFSVPLTNTQLANATSPLSFIFESQHAETVRNSGGGFLISFACGSLCVLPCTNSCLDCTGTWVAFHSGDMPPTSARVSTSFSSSLALSCWKKSSSRSSSWDQCALVLALELLDSSGYAIFACNRIISETTRAIKEMPLIMVRVNPNLSENFKPPASATQVKRHAIVQLWPLFPSFFVLVMLCYFIYTACFIGSMGQVCILLPGSCSCSPCCWWVWIIFTLPRFMLRASIRFRWLRTTSQWLLWKSLATWPGWRQGSEHGMVNFKPRNLPCKTLC